MRLEKPSQTVFWSIAVCKPTQRGNFEKEEKPEQGRRGGRGVRFSAKEELVLFEIQVRIMIQDIVSDRLSSTILSFIRECVDTALTFSDFVRKL